MILECVSKGLSYDKMLDMCNEVEGFGVTIEKCNLIV